MKPPVVSTVIIKASANPDMLVSLDLRDYEFQKLNLVSYPTREAAKTAFAFYRSQARKAGITLTVEDTIGLL